MSRLQKARVLAVGDLHLENFGTWRDAEGRLVWHTADINEDLIEAFHATLHTAGRAASTRNHYTALLKALFRWAVRKGGIARSPISHESSLRRAKVAQRRRRLSLEEETALLSVAGALKHGAGLRLQWVIMAALETGARVGELLAIRWSDVNWEKRLLLIRAVEEGAKMGGRGSCPSRRDWRPCWRWRNSIRRGESILQAPTYSAPLANGSRASRKPGRRRCSKRMDTSRSGSEVGCPTSHAPACPPSTFISMI